MNKWEKFRYKWIEVYSYVIPFVLVLLYIVYIYMITNGVITGKLVQESRYFDKMLETLVTFMSIILSVFGFLIPSFLGGKGETETVNYFLKYADMKVFATKLKNVVAFGLIDIFLTCVLLIIDIIPETILNVVIVIWLWILFYFMCSSYRFISLMINLLVYEKKRFVQEATNKVSKEDIEKVHSNTRIL